MKRVTTTDFVTITLTAIKTQQISFVHIATFLQDAWNQCSKNARFLVGPLFIGKKTFFISLKCSLQNHDHVPGRWSQNRLKFVRKHRTSNANETRYFVWPVFRINVEKLHFSVMTFVQKRCPVTERGRTALLKFAKPCPDITDSLQTTSFRAIQAARRSFSGLARTKWHFSRRPTRVSVHATICTV